LSSPGFQQIQAVATNLDGFTVRQDFMPMMRKYVRENMVLWTLLRKEKAEADVIKEILEPPGTAPAAGFMDKVTLNPVGNPANLQNYDLADPGQQIKAFGGLIRVNHYSRSLDRQQNSPYGNQTGRKTDRLFIQTLKAIERGLFTGNATTNPLAFNGLERQMPVANNYAASIIAGDSVVQKLRGIVRLASADEEILKDSTHIFTSGLGVELIEQELMQKLQYHNLDVIRPGFKVPAMETHSGLLPLISSPYIRDVAGAIPVTDPGFVDFYIFNINDLIWKYVVPEGGEDTYLPQVFDVSKYADVSSPLLLEKRLCLGYGALYAGNRGASLYKLRVTIQPNRVGNI
jgi:hypothetical protein